MRPVLLTMEGFASFRDRTELDFRDIDYFALVGRTGAGKSTVIDALTFALYGTADRWGRDNAIRYALAPTANQAKVSLVFDAGGHRYVIAREVRRYGQAPPQQKSVSLELLADPHGLGAADEEPGTVLAGDPKKARQVVSSLLGLDFDEFCTCVVLPQGKFSEFLVSEPRKRREILSRLLGDQRYEQMRQLADRRAENAAGTVAALRLQLQQRAEHSEGELEDLHCRHHQLVELAATVELAVAELRTIAAAVPTRANAAKQLAADLSLLLLEIPEEAGRLDELVEVSQAELARAERAAVEVDAALEAAREQQQAAPSADRAKQLLTDHGRVDRLLSELPELEQNRVRSADEEARLELRAKETEQAREAARMVRDEHRRERDQRAAELDGLLAQLELLGSIHPPTGLADLSERRAQIASRGEAAGRSMDEADARVRLLRDQQADPAELARLQTQLSRLTALSSVEVHLVTLVEQQTALQEDSDQAADRRSAAAADLEQLQNQLHELRVSTAAADLRADLHSGDTCPVCAQPVTEVPARQDTDGAGTKALAARIQVAKTGLRELESTARTAESALNQQRARREQAERQLTEERLALAGVDRTSLDRELERARVSAGELADAETAAEGARADARSVAKAQEELRDAEQAARRHLNGELRRIAALLPPAVDDSTLNLAWAELTGWAEQQLGVVGQRRSAAELATVVAEQLHETAIAEFELAAEVAETAVTSFRAAARAAVEADQLHRRCTDEITDLTAVLADAPDAAEAQRLLDQAIALTRVVADRTREATTAKTRLSQARIDAVGLQTRLVAARQELSRSRDPLVRLGAPAMGGESLLGDWTLLLDWAGVTATELQVRLAEQEAELGELTKQLAEEGALLASTMRDRGVPMPVEVDSDELTRSAVTWVALAVDDARRVAVSAVQDQQDRARITAELAVAEERRAVAADLGLLLRPSQFGKWLTNTVMSRLVQDASQTLFDLSRGQFSLSHDDRSEFVVIDHFDADSTRPVRTLSGGETFQASLALALALSAQMAALGAGGVSRLGSIFLDEGFGTLDPEALTVVADTLQTLANGDRLVGVVTHVEALAETIPHRFIVERDSRTSSIRQETL